MSTNLDREIGTIKAEIKFIKEDFGEFKIFVREEFGELKGVLRGLEKGFATREYVRREVQTLKAEVDFWIRLKDRILQIIITALAIGILALIGVNYV